MHVCMYVQYVCVRVLVTLRRMQVAILGWHIKQAG